MRQNGTVKFFNPSKGFGFITPDDGGKDVFVHITAVERSNVGPLSENMRVSFETEPDKRGKGPKAVNLQLAGIEEAPLSEPPPPLPQQGAGPHFRIDETGRVSFAAPASLDEVGNNVGRLHSLQPLLVQAARQVVSSISPNEHKQLLSLAEQYLGLVDKDIGAIDFARLYGLGLRLANSVAAARREVESRILPELEDTAREAIDSLIELHGPFVLASKAGQEIIADAERYARRPEDEAALREAAEELGRGLEQNRQVAGPEVGKFIRETVSEIGADENAERVASYSTGTMKNVSIVIIGGASLAAMPVVGGVLAGPAGVAAGAFAVLVGGESLKKSKAFSQVTGNLTKQIDVLTEAGIDARTLAEKLRPLKQFTIRYESQLRKLAGKNPVFNWLHRYLDWLKTQT